MTASSDTASVGDDPRRYAFTVWNYRQGEIIAAMIYLGDQLGLYKAMAGAGPLRAGELAGRAGLHERWVLEWLRLQAAAKLVDYRGDDRFELPNAAIDLLVDAEQKSYAAGEFAGPGMADTLDRLFENFRTGLGNSYEEGGPEGAHRGECRHWQAARNDLIPKMIPALAGVEDKLKAGALVGDVGCGDGAAVLAMADTYAQPSRRRQPCPRPLEQDVQFGREVGPSARRLQPMSPYRTVSGTQDGAVFVGRGIGALGNRSLRSGTHRHGISRRHCRHSTPDLHRRSPGGNPRSAMARRGFRAGLPTSVGEQDGRQGHPPERPRPGGPERVGAQGGQPLGHRGT
jgi:hypothetical protein